MEFEKNTMLFGADRTPRIVAIELGETGTVKVYRRGKGGSTVVEVEPFHPFVWCDSDVLDLGIESEKLESSLKYGWLVTVDSWKELIAMRNGLRNARRAQAPNESCQRARSGRDRGSQSLSVRSALPSPARQENENETRLGTKRRLFTFPPFAAADRREDNRLSEVHSRWPPFRRYFFARAILR